MSGATSRSARGLVYALSALVWASCGDAIGPGNGLEIRVFADAPRVHEFVTYEIRNRSEDTLFVQACPASAAEKPVVLVEKFVGDWMTPVRSACEGGPVRIGIAPGTVFRDSTNLFDSAGEYRIAIVAWRGQTDSVSVRFHSRSFRVLE